MEQNKNNEKEENNLGPINPTTSTNINSEKKGNLDNDYIKSQIQLKNNLYIISRKIRYFIYILELFCLFNLDQGGISASTKEIKNHFKMNDSELGSFGGISFLGTTLGGIFSLSIINKINRKYLILIFLTTIISSLFFPTIISSKIILILSRIITGFSQSFMSIYLPVWVDQFGIYDKKSIMMSIISIPSAFGYLVGYITAVFTSWRMTFLVNCFISTILLISFLFMKKIYFSKDIFPKK
jgi:MFS family permease